MNFSMRGHDFDAKSVKEVSSKCAEYGIYGVQLVMAKTIEKKPADMIRIKTETSRI